MPRRITPLVEGETYHVFNRGVNKQEIYSQDNDFARFVESINFFLYEAIGLKYSTFLKLTTKQQQALMEVLFQNKRATLHAYTLMPNHFHFLVTQNNVDGISSLLRHLQDSYSRYFNIRYDRIGPLWQGQFKAVRIQNEYQLLHVSRYIHLNPYSAGIVKTKSELLNYKWSSLNEYIKPNKQSLCDLKLILANFKSPEDYKRFVLDNADYQKQLQQIKHLCLDTPEVYTPGV